MTSDGSVTRPVCQPISVIAADIWLTSGPDTSYVTGSCPAPPHPAPYHVTSTVVLGATVCTRSWRLVHGLPLNFSLQAQHTLPAFLGVFARVMAGPAIVMRNAIRGALREGRAPFWLALSTIISTIWSFFTGVVILELLFRL